MPGGSGVAHSWLCILANTFLKHFTGSAVLCLCMLVCVQAESCRKVATRRLGDARGT